MVKRDAGHRLLAGHERWTSKPRVCHRRERRHSAESVSARAIDEEPAWLSLSLGVEYRSRIASCTFPTARERLGTILGAFTHAGRSAPIPKFQKDHPWTKLSARIKGGFSFVLFSPCLYLSPCAEAPRLLTLIHFMLLLLHFELPL